MTEIGPAKHFSVPAIELKNISKRFGGTQALQGVSLALYPQEIHALLGENGAGKSTLIKIMTGVHKPDEGEILVGGQSTKFGSSANAQRQGVVAIYQEPLLFPDLSVAENIYINHQDRGRVVKWSKLRKDAEAVLLRLGVSLDVRRDARGLALAEQQAVEIAKALSMSVRVLIMDEPTASLSAHEVDRLLGIMRDLRAAGVAILFVSHRLEEVFEVADKITVLRDGKWISTRPRVQFTRDLAITEMVGRDVRDLKPRAQNLAGRRLISVRKLGRTGSFADINFELRGGEVLGFAGLIGAGRTDVALALFGIAPADQGEISVGDKAVSISSVHDAIAHGIAYVSEDRRQFGLSLPMSITENITLSRLSHYANWLGIVDKGKERLTSEYFKRALNIRTQSLDLAVGKLSGGNQQKVMLSKWLNIKPSILILDEPTRGIDVGAKVEVHAMIDDLASQGVGIIMISSDLPEVLAMSDRVLVMREGRQIRIIDRADATQQSVMTAAMGHH